MSCIITHKKKKVYKSIVYPIFIYWITLVLVQNLGEYVGTSSISLAIKAALVVYLSISFFIREVTFKTLNILLWIIFTGFVLLNLTMHEQVIDGSIIIYYFFPIIFTFLTFVCGSDTKISRKDYFKFLKLVIATVTYMCLYSIFFRTSHFLGMFSFNSAYGNELTSFFYSSHEYGMYLVFGITSIMICYQATKKLKVRFLYLCLLLLFSANLVVTFSRTSYLACVVIIAVFVFLSRNHKIKKWFIIAIAILAAVIIFIPQMREFVFRMMFKENNDAGRFDMWEIAMRDYKTFPFYQKLLGGGLSATKRYVGITFEHGSLHNMILQVLFVWGVAGMVFMVCVVIHSISNAIRIYRKDRNMSVIFLALSFSAIAFMMTNTACLMQSPIDSYMLTVFTVIIPKYVSNYIEEKKPRKRKKRSYKPMLSRMRRKKRR